MTRRKSAAVVLSALAFASIAATQDSVAHDADSMEKKLNAIIQNADLAPGKVKPQRISFTDREVNAYFKRNGKAHLPTGVVDPEITIADERFVQSRAIVDLDAVRKSKDRSILDPANLFLRGTVELRISGYVVASNGKGQFQLESATIGSLPVPKGVL